MVLGAKKHQTSVTEFVLSLQSVAIKIGQENYAEAVKFYHRGGAVAVKLTSRRCSGGEINAKVVQNLGKFTNSPCLSAFLTLFFVKSVKKTVKDHCSLSCARCLLPADGAKSIYVKRAEQKTLQTLHRALHSPCISLILRALHCVGFGAKILHKPCIEPYIFEHELNTNLGEGKEKFEEGKF